MIFFLQKDKNLTHNKEDIIFFEHQLDLYQKLCYVRKRLDDLILS